VFINYRTKDGKETAYVIDQGLSGRFGTDSIFRAPKSIEPGANYIDALVNGVRRSSVLLALIGPDWLNAPDRKRPDRRALDGAEDWVRREIEEAFACGVLVVPILLGRHTEQLERQHLPSPLAGLADCQYLRFSLRNAESDLAHLGDRLTKQVPALAALDKSPATAEAPDPSDSLTVRNRGQRGGIGNVGGNVGTFVNESKAPLHTGSGDQISNQINGDGTNHLAGDNHGGIHQQFGPPRRREGGER
jgi:hypothetical protein